MARPHAALRPLEAPRIRTGDVFATAFHRYGGAFATLGALAFAFWVVPAVATYVLDATIDSDRAVAFSSLALAVVAFFSYCGAVAAHVGGRLRAKLPAVIATAVVAAPPIAILPVLFPPALAVIAFAFLVSPFVLAPVAVGAGDAGVRGALTTTIPLMRGHILRGTAIASGVVLISVAIWLGFSLALAPVPSTPRVAINAFLWGVIAWPLAALVFRSFYGALTGKLVVRQGDIGPER
jgi:hypothetical protein